MLKCKQRKELKLKLDQIRRRPNQVRSFEEFMSTAILVLTRTPTPPIPLLSHVAENDSSPVSYMSINECVVSSRSVRRRF
ncbi:hypothetical protein RB195_025948 [Necator americanus]|uniref:Uncharacterized protein n=1 Tax=Necator americanus TaxID=51031 RepID=A0ABR1EUR6_NECAM